MLSSLTMRNLVSLLLIAFTLFGCARSLPPQPPPLDPSMGNIVYAVQPFKLQASESGANLAANALDMVMISAGGNNRRRIAHFKDGVADPTLSMDGKTFAFTTNSEKPGAVFVGPTTGGKPRQITDGKTWVAAPVLSLDGKRLVYNSWDSDDEMWNLHIVNVDGTNNIKLTSGPRTESFANWAPDGKVLFFHVRDDDDSWHIARINSDGTKYTMLTAGPHKDWLPSVSWDGSKVAFWSTRSGTWEIYVMNPDGSNPRQISHDNGRTGDGICPPNWSLDDKYISFSCRRTSDMMDIIVQDMDGVERQLTNDGLNNYGPGWVPETFSLPYDKTQYLVVTPTEAQLRGQWF